MKKYEPNPSGATLEQYEPPHLNQIIWSKATHNLSVWGHQDPIILVACMTEELGELARAILQGDADNARDETIDLAALCLQMLEAVERERD